MCLADASLSVPQIVALLLIGSGAGVLGGLLGIGGGLVMIPAMVLVFDDFGGQPYGANSLHLYKLAALATAVVLSVPAVRQHAQAGAIVPRMLGGIILFGVVGSLLGVGLARLLADEHTTILRRIFGAFMLAVVALNVWQGRRRGAAAAAVRDRCPVPNRWAQIGAVVGLPAGVVSGLLGVGGGVVAVPVQHFLLGLRLPSAIANSACMIVALALCGTLAQALALHGLAGISAWEGFLLAALLAPGAIIGGFFGAWLTHRLPIRWLRNAFYALLVLTGLRLIWA